METGQVAESVVTTTAYTYRAKDAPMLVSLFKEQKKTGSVEFHFSQGNLLMVIVKERHK